MLAAPSRPHSAFSTPSRAPRMSSSPAGARSGHLLTQMPSLTSGSYHPLSGRAAELEALVMLGAVRLAEMVVQLRRENDELRAALDSWRHLDQASKTPPQASTRHGASSTPVPPPALGRLPTLRSPQELTPQPTRTKAGTDEEGTDTPAKDRQPGKLERRISRVPANMQLASRIREELAADVSEGSSLGASFGAGRYGLGGDTLQKLVHANFFLPDLSSKKPALRDFLLEKLLCPHHQKQLEQAGALNWAVSRGQLGPEHRLNALWTQADGNCLLHATLLAIGALHDTHSVGPKGLSSLRAAMSRLLNGSLETALQKRWREQLTRDHSSTSASSKAGGTPLPLGQQSVGDSFSFEVTEDQHRREWAEMKAIAGRQGAFLDSIHVFALAHVLQRPVVMIAQATYKDTWGVPLTPVHFRGVYLPLELRPSECSREPLVLCFQDSHFMPLVPQERAGCRSPVLVPLADGSGEPLPVRFARDQELVSSWATVRQYMDIEEMFVVTSSSPGMVRHAVLQRRDMHPLVKEMLEAFLSCGEDAFEEEQAETRGKTSPDDASAQSSREAEGQKAASQQGSREAEASKAASQQERADAELAAQLAAEDRGELLVPPLKPPEQDSDTVVEEVINVRLPLGARPGDTLRWEKVNFTVPDGYYGDDIMPLKVRQVVSGASIRQFQDVTQASRDQAARMLARSHGSVDKAVSDFLALT